MKRSRLSISDTLSIDVLNVIIAVLAAATVIGAIIARPFIYTFSKDMLIDFSLSIITGYFLINALYIFIERKALLEQNRHDLQHLIDSVGIMKIISSSTEYYEMLMGKMENAESSIDLIYLTPEPPSKIGRGALHYWEWFQSFAKERNKVMYDAFSGHLC